MRVKDIMTAPVICAPADTPVPDVARLLTKHGISAVPVTDEHGFVIGLVSEYDVLARSGEAARDIMSAGIVTVSEDTDIDEVRFLLVERRIKRVPVLAGHRLVGIVSRSDIIRLISVQWYCDICGEPVRGEHPPQACPKCTAPAARFAQSEQPPGD
ncbi:MAG: CBS domain-containing protein [Chloroflexi bacterium]|nr:CBS domain-containing protein [Chloroflexota bacterium]